MIKTFRYRVKSKAGLLDRWGRAVNFVWNFCNNTQKKALEYGRKWPSGYDLAKLTAGSSKELGLNSATIQLVGLQYEKSRSQKKRPFLRYRGRKSLGWVPVRQDCIRRDGADTFRFSGISFRVFMSRLLPEGKIKDGSSFSCDSRGRWYLNIAIEVPNAEAREPIRGVGIDLGLKEFACLSTGEKIGNPRWFRNLESKLKGVQRANKKRQVTNLHAKIRNARLDFHHKVSTRIVKAFDYIAVGNVNASGLAKTKMAKSVLDAGWSSFRNMLRYKAITHGAWYSEVDEKFTTQVCSNCGNLPNSRPKGIADLGIRSWICSDCGVSHDRDHNAALNILTRAGHCTLAEGIPVL